MGPVYIAIADMSHARIYSQEGRGRPLRLVQDLAHPDAAKHNAQLGSDRPGHPSAFLPHTDPKTVEQNRFARDLAGYLNTARAGGRFAELVLAMGPRMLGLVKGELTDQTSKTLAATIETDLIHLPEHELGKRLQADWFVPNPAFQS